jgi:transposase-like protein
MRNEPLQSQRKSENSTEEMRVVREPPKAPETPDPELAASRRRFTAEYKQRVLRAADACQKPGELGALLRREGLYSSHLTTWRRAREKRELEALRPRPRGPKAKRRDPREQEIAVLKQENARLQAQLKKAEILLAIQKKVARLFGEPQLKRNAPQ